MGKLRSTFDALSDGITAHPYVALGVCVAIGLAVMWTAARKS